MTHAPRRTNTDTTPTPGTALPDLPRLPVTLPRSMVNPLISMGYVTLRDVIVPFDPTDTPAQAQSGACTYHCTASALNALVLAQARQDDDGERITLSLTLPEIAALAGVAELVEDQDVPPPLKIVATMIGMTLTVKLRDFTPLTLEESAALIGAAPPIPPDFPMHLSPEDFIARNWPHFPTHNQNREGGNG